MDISVNMGKIRLCSLSYADDTALLLDNELDLQRLLDKLHNWCQGWRMFIDRESKFVHFRKCKVKRTNLKIEFKIGENKLALVVSYKYLGGIFK